MRSTRNPPLSDIVAVSAVRTPMGKFGGTLKGTPVYDIGAAAIRGCLARLNLDGSSIQDTIIGCCRHTGNGTNPARTALLQAQLPPSASATTITMACASGMRAVILGIQAILAGEADVVLAGGMESMSTIPHLLLANRWQGLHQGHKTMVDGWFDSRDPILHHKMPGVIMEDYLRKLGISRKKQDDYAYQSLRRTQKAEHDGDFQDEIVPVGSFLKDETIRAEASRAKLSELPSIFVEDGSVTAGNASLFSDGAAMLVLTTRQKAKSLGASPLFSFVSFASGAVPNDLMGEGPSALLPLALEKSKLSFNTIDFIEINEAFAGMVIANQERLNLDEEKLNVRGGGIALGHPVGASGARIVVSLYHILKHHDKEYGAASIGAVGGVCTAVIIKREA